MLVREALQYSLNIPAIRVIDRAASATVRQYAVRAGFSFMNGDRKGMTLGLAGAIGTVEMRMLDLDLRVRRLRQRWFQCHQPRLILKVDARGGPDGSVDLIEAKDPAGPTQVWSPQTAYIMADILKGNTNPAVNSVWGPIFELRQRPEGSLRERAVKTGTTNDLKDLLHLRPPASRQQDAASLRRRRLVRQQRQLLAQPGQPPVLDGHRGSHVARLRARLHQGLARSQFKRPAKGIVAATIDAYTGGTPGPWTRGTRTELFIPGTQPGAKREVDPPGLMYSRDCSVWVVQPARAENPGAPASWLAAVNAWASRGGLGPASGAAVGATSDWPASPRSAARGPRRQLFHAAPRTSDRPRTALPTTDRWWEAPAGGAHLPSGLHRQASGLRRPHPVEPTRQDAAPGTSTALTGVAGLPRLAGHSSADRLSCSRCGRAGRPMSRPVRRR